MRENHEKWGVATKILLTQLPLTTNFQTWYLIKA